jgi:hypothetical protein
MEWLKTAVCEPELEPIQEPEPELELAQGHGQDLGHYREQDQDSDPDLDQDLNWEIEIFDRICTTPLTLTPDTRCKNKKHYNNSNSRSSIAGKGPPSLRGSLP